MGKGDIKDIVEAFNSSLFLNELTEDDLVKSGL